MGKSTLRGHGSRPPPPKKNRKTCPTTDTANVICKQTTPAMIPTVRKKKNSKLREYYFITIRILTLNLFILNGCPRVEPATSRSTETATLPNSTNELTPTDRLTTSRLLTHLWRGSSVLSEVDRPKLNPFYFFPRQKLNDSKIKY